LSRWDGASAEQRRAKEQAQNSVEPQEPDQNQIREYQLDSELDITVLEHALARYRAPILDEHAEPQSPLGRVPRAVVSVVSADERLDAGVIQPVG
jgi:hypothetical protein